MATRYLDFENGSDANDATTFANRVKTFAGLAGKVASGDTVRIMKSLDATALGSCTWTNASRAVTIPAGVIKDVDTCDAAWTPATNVTASTTTTRKQGTNANSLAIAAAFATGQVAFKALGATVDFSAYQILNLWVQANATVASGVFRVDLCSDAAGATPVNSFTINVALNPTGNWHAIVIDNGSALSSSIQSVAITALSDPGTVTLIVDNLFVSKATSAADCLTLNSLIRKTTPTTTDIDLVWNNIVSASGTSVEIGGGITSNIASSRTYVGTTETVATSVRQSIFLTPTTATTTALNTAVAADGSSAAAPITYAGGWDRTSMATQDGETWVHYCNGAGFAYHPNTRRYLTFQKLGVLGASTAFYFSNGDYITWDHCYSVGASNYSFLSNSNTQGHAHTFLSCIAAHMTNSGWGFTSGPVLGGQRWNDCIAYGTTTGGTTPGFQNGCPDAILTNCRSYNHAAYGFDPGSAGDPDVWMMENCAANYNGSGSLRMQSGGGSIYTRNCTFSDTNIYVNSGNWDNTRLVCARFGGSATDHRIYMWVATMTSETGANRRTGSGLAYKWLLTGTNRDTAEGAARYCLGKFFVQAGQTFTYTIWVNRSATTINARLRIPGGWGWDANLSSDVVSAAASSSAYEQLSVSVTPAADIEVPVYLEIWGGVSSTFIYFDDSSQTWS